MTRTICWAILCFALSSGPSWTSQESGTSAEFRSLSVVNDNVVWTGGRGGVFARTVDGGKTWKSDSIPGASGLFIIGIYGVDAQIAYAAGTSFNDSVPLAKIFKTTDGGGTWIEQYSNNQPKIFLDGITFLDSSHGVALGDPIDGLLLVLTTVDGGVTWTRVPPDKLPGALSGEAAFAASGRAITSLGDHVWIGTGGGANARVFRSADRGQSWQVSTTPMVGNASTGIFALSFRDAQHGIAVGGDYRYREHPETVFPNVMRTSDGGATWTMVGRAQPVGVLYGVTYAKLDGRQAVVASGPPGTSYSFDEGTSWTVIDTISFNTVSVARSGSTVFGAGPRGRVARLNDVGEPKRD
jgi:photosystem II stability/assembly factor-like uncharacterized protein